MKQVPKPILKSHTTRKHKEEVLREEIQIVSLELSPPPDYREQHIATPETNLQSCIDFMCDKCGTFFEVGNSLEEHRIKMHLNPADESECFNCCKEFNSIVKCSANLVL